MQQLDQIIFTFEKSAELCYTINSLENSTWSDLFPELKVEIEN